MASSEIYTQKQEFEAAFKSLLSKDVHLLPFVQRWLNKYGLNHIEPFVILSDVYLDGIKAIEKGKIIKNPKAWIRTVAKNKIADIMRNQYKDKEHSIELDAIEYTDDFEYKIALQNSDEDADLDQEILLEKLLKERDKLEPENQMIFDLRFRQDLPWENVRKHLASSGIHLNTSTLRKRGERIKEQIKQFLLTED